MTDLLRRASTAPDLEVRGDGRTVVGIAMPFDTPTTIYELGRKYQETFKRGAFARTLEQRASKVKVLALHDTKRLPLGVAHSLREDTKGLYTELRVAATRDGDEALELVREGALDGLSIGFLPVSDRWSRDRSSVDRLEVKLREVSLVPFPAYEDARIEAVRTHDPELDLRLRLLRLKAL